MFQGSARRLIRRVPSTTSESSDPLIGLASHPEWKLIGRDSANDSVSIYVNRRILATFDVRLLSDPVDHPDILLVSLVPPAGPPINIMNIYNNSNNAAIRFLMHHASNLLPISIIQGDFNLRSPLWDHGATVEDALVHDLLEITNSCDLMLVENGDAPTWHSPSPTSRRSTVIDLVFAHADIVDSGLLIYMNNPGARMSSDHSVIQFSLQTDTPRYPFPPFISRKREEGYIAALVQAVLDCARSVGDIDSRQNVRGEFDRPFSAMNRCWTDNVTIPKRDGKPKRWKRHKLVVRHPDEGELAEWMYI